ncbi:flagellum targeting protein kharon1 [Novymonas esmeraldas]|uniref:Flagellum targeting protein kharon1 n=1 Tax=Novymonas esmeraldas TaxID=1808958 RepID=A0AAW0F7J5_9TRYP
MTQDSSAPAQSEPRYQSPSQRARKDRSGENAARAILGLAPVQEDAEVRPTPGRHHGTAPRNNFSSPTEFLAGPRQPPRQQSGIRRNPNANRDTVGNMLTDEYFMIHNPSNSLPIRGAPLKSADPRGSVSADAGAWYGAAAKRGEGAARQKHARNQASKNAGVSGATAPIRYRDGLTYNCIVTAPEQEWHSGVKITQPQGGMDAPYFEDTDPRPPREEPAVTGKRHVRPPYKDAKLFGQAPPLRPDEEDFHNELPPCRKTANKANESVDVLNLHCYSADELSEKPQSYKQLGPRHFVAPDMPPKKPALIRQIHTTAKNEHDVLGTGRWGVPEKEHPHGVARGSCRPPRDTANLFRGGIAPPEDKSSSQSGRAPRSSSNQSRPSRQVQPFRSNSRSGSPKKRPDPVFNDADRPRKLLNKKNAGSPNMLRYYDPAVDQAPEAAAKRPIPRSNLECKLDDSNTPLPGGKGRGEFSNNGRSTIALL